MTSNRPHDHAARRRRAAESLGELPALLVTNPVNVRWLTDFTGSNGSVLLTGDEAILVTDERYAERVRAAGSAPDLLVTYEPARDVLAWLAEHGLDQVGLESGHVSWEAATRWQAAARESGIKVTAATDIIENLRAVKDATELDRLRAACRITTDVLKAVIDGLRAGQTEADVARSLEDGFVAAGAEAPAFDSIVASGPNGARPHHGTGDRPIAAGDLVTIDCGARVDGYHADCTRTIAIGHAPDVLAEVHVLVCRAQAAGREAVLPGVGGADVDKAARGVIDGAGHGDAFVHGTGHGVGLEIHEAPAIGTRATSTLTAGMTITVEPGVYLPGIGGVRVEDTVLVTDEGHEVLTDLPHDLLVVQG